MIATNDTENAQRETVGAEESQAYLEQVISDNVALTEQNKQLTSEVATLKQSLEELQQAMESGKFN